MHVDVSSGVQSCQRLEAILETPILTNRQLQVIISSYTTALGRGSKHE
jgi:hypothetical protein